MVLWLSRLFLRWKKTHTHTHQNWNGNETEAFPISSTRVGHRCFHARRCACLCALLAKLSTFFASLGCSRFDGNDLPDLGEETNRGKCRLVSWQIGREINVKGENRFEHKLITICLLLSISFNNIILKGILKQIRENSRIFKIYFSRKLPRRLMEW